MEINVCIGSACHLKGSYEVIKEFQKAIEEFGLGDKVALKGSFCLNQCTKAVSTKINNEIISMSPDKVREQIIIIAKENDWII